MNEREAAPAVFGRGCLFVDCARGACGYPLFPCGRMAVRKAQLCRAEGRKGPCRRAARFLSCDGLYPPAIRAFEEVLTHGKEGEGRPRPGGPGRPEAHLDEHLEQMPAQELPADIPAEVREKLARDLNDKEAAETCARTSGTPKKRRPKRRPPPPTS